MRLLLTLSVVVLALSLASAGKGKRKSSMLLGADDVDKKAAELNPPSQSKDKTEDAAKTPQSLKEVKKLTKEDKQLIKELQNRLKTIKQAIKNGNTSKGDKKKLKKEFRELKSEVHSKRTEFNHLKAVKNELKLEKETNKKVPNRRGGKGGKKRGENVVVDRATAHPTIPTTTTTTTTTTTSTPKPVTTAAPETTKLSKADRKALKKERRLKKNKNKGKNSLNQLMQADAPVIDVSVVKNMVKTSAHQGHRKMACSSNADCKDGGVCRTNRKGHKVCKRGHNNKPAGKKCHSSEQCSGGLQCFVTHTPEMMKHKKHPRRGKGICADPKTTDSRNGEFITYKTIT